MNPIIPEPLNPAEQAQADYGDNVIWQLLGSTIVAFGGNADGEIFLSARKDGKVTEFIIGKDEQGEISLFEVEKVAA